MKTHDAAEECMCAGRRLFVSPHEAMEATGLTIKEPIWGATVHSTIEDDPLFSIALASDPMLVISVSKTQLRNHRKGLRLTGNNLVMKLGDHKVVRVSRGRYYIHWRGTTCLRPGAGAQDIWSFDDLGQNPLQFIQSLRPLPKFEVLAGNIGSVHTGDSFKAAVQCFEDYQKQSVEQYGRVAGETVLLLRNGERIREHQGSREFEFHAED